MQKGMIVGAVLFAVGLAVGYGLAKWPAGIAIAPGGGQVGIEPSGVNPPIPSGVNPPNTGQYSPPANSGQFKNSVPGGVSEPYKGGVSEPK